MDNNQAGIIVKKVNTIIKTLGTEKAEVEHRKGLN
jgi:hypothetical protein